jgi:arylsulfatase A-like enzyme
MNVLMIVSDTIRQDFFGINGGPVSTPNLDALARESVYFRRAYANSFPTVPARADYLTGVYALTDIGWGPLPRGAVTLPELLSQAGVTTVGVVDTPFYMCTGYNYDRGFDYFTDLLSQRPVGKWRGIGETVRTSEYDYCAPLTFVTAEKALEHLTDKPFFLLVDTWDPHEPWDPPAYYAKRYKPDYDGRVVNPVYGPLAHSNVTDDDLATAIACYCGELEMVDRWLGRLLERLESLRLADDTVIIFDSDHGFYFGEHGLFGKLTRSGPTNDRWLRSPLYPEIAHVPLMVRVPGVAPRDDDRVVSAAINIAPTVLDLFGLEKPAHMLGRSLLALVRSPDVAGDDVAITALPLGAPGAEVRVVDDMLRDVKEWQPITVNTSEWMLVFARWDEPIELYATSDGHGGGLGRNLADEHPEVVKDLHAKLIAELERAGASEEAITARS